MAVPRKLYNLNLLALGLSPAVVGQRVGRLLGRNSRDWTEEQLRETYIHSID